MIKIQLKALSGDRSGYLHLKQIFIVDEEGYSMDAYYPCSSKHAWNKKGFWTKVGVIRADLKYFVKEHWTEEDFEKEHNARLDQMKADWVAKDEHNEEFEINPFKAEEAGEYPFDEETKQKRIDTMRKYAKESERFAKAFVKCLEEGVGLTKEKAQELYKVIREKLVRCCEFGFNNLIDNFWFKIGNEVIVEVDNELAYQKAWDKETIAKAKAMLIA